MRVIIVMLPTDNSFPFMLYSKEREPYFWGADNLLYNVYGEFFAVQLVIGTNRKTITSDIK